VSVSTDNVSKMLLGAIQKIT